MLKLLLVCLIYLASQGSLAEELKKYKFGVVPQQAATQLIQNWAPLLKKLSADCSCIVEFATAPDISAFEAKIKNKDFDLVYLNPMHFVQTGREAGYQSLVREQNRKLKGILVVSKDSPIKKIADLKNNKIAFPGPTSFAATVLVKKLFEKEQIEIEPVYVKSHESVYLNVISGVFAAGGGVNRTYEALPDTDKAKLKVLASSVEVTPHPIAIHQRVDAKLKVLFLATLTGLKDSPEGQKILDDLELKQLVAAKDSDWDDAKALLAEKKSAP